MSTTEPATNSDNEQRIASQRRTSGRVPSRLQEVLLILLQWLALVLLLGAAMVRAARALEDYDFPHIDATLMVGVGVLCGAALGVTVRNIRLMYVLALLLPLAAAAILACVIYLPAWQGIIVGTIGFANFAQQQAIVMLLVVFVPVLVGATVGYAMAGGVRNAFERHAEALDGNTEARQAWFDRNRSA